MEHINTPTLLFWSSQLLNVVALSSNMPGWAKWIVAALGLLLTVISLINQAVTLYKNAKEWQWVMVTKTYYLKIKNRKKTNG